MKRLTAIVAALALFCGGAQAQTSPGLVSPNQVVAGPSSGVTPGLPSGRTLVGGDIPFLGTMATQNANNVDITGGIVTGLPSPTGSADAATKMYVDSVAAGLIIHSQAILATAAALPTNTYNNGTSGVGATLTGTTNGALTVDGVLTTTSNRIVVKNEATIANCGGGSVVGCSNGIYTVTTVGDGSHPYVLTRATDANSPGTSNPNEIGLGTFVFVISGTANGNTGWSVNSVVTTIGTSAINWVQFSGGSASGVTSLGGMSGILSCGSNITCTGSTVSVAASGSNGQVQANNSGVLGGLTNTQLTTLINPFSSSLSGAVPSSGGGTANFLRADGTWVAAGQWTTSGNNISNNNTGTVTVDSGGLVSGAQGFIVGANPGSAPIGSILWNTAPMAIGGTLSQAGDSGNSSSDEFMVYLQSNVSRTTTSLTSTANTSSGSVISVNSVPAFVQNCTTNSDCSGIAVYDLSHGIAIPGGTVVASATSSTITMTNPVASTVSIGDVIIVQFENFKGPLFLEAVCGDFSNGSTSCNGLTGYTSIPNGTPTGFAEGIVMYTNGVGTGDGLMIGLETGVGPINSTNSAHCDTSVLASPCHTAIWIGNNGTKAGSWEIDTSLGGAGYNNGISIRNITNGGTALATPQNTVVNFGGGGGGLGQFNVFNATGDYGMSFQGASGGVGWIVMQSAAHGNSLCLGSAGASQPSCGSIQITATSSVIFPLITTGTPSSYACFDSSNTLIKSGSPC